MRPLRACRFAAQLGFAIDPATKAAIPRALDVAARVSAERVRDEIVKILVPAALGRFPVDARDRAARTLETRKLAACDGVAQGDLHCWDVLTHSLMSGPTRRRAPTLCCASPRSSTTSGSPLWVSATPDGRPTFHGHERLSRSIVSAVLERLRFPSAVIQAVAHLVGEHMFNYTEEWSDAAVRRLVAKVGEQHIDALIALRRADHAGMCPGNADAYPQGLVSFADHVRAVREGSRAFTVRDLAVDGTAVMELVGCPGPSVGAVLAELLEAVLDDPSLNELDGVLALLVRVPHMRD